LFKPHQFETFSAGKQSAITSGVRPSPEFPGCAALSFRRMTRLAIMAEVQYEYLQGVTEVTCAAFLDSSGNVIEQKQLSGLTTQSSSSSTTYRYR
jgi:hypothetical protein